MKNLALLLTVSVLLLSYAIPVEALSLNYDFVLEMNSQHLDQPNSSVDSDLGTKAIPQISLISEQPVTINFDPHANRDITEKSIATWMKDTKVQTHIVVPEPASLILLGGGLLGLAGLNRRWIKSNR